LNLTSYLWPLAQGKNSSVDHNINIVFQRNKTIKSSSDPFFFILHSAL